METLLKSLEKNSILVALLPGNGYKKAAMKISRAVAGAFDRICYVSCSLPCSTVLQDLKRDGIDSSKFFFVDCSGQGVNEKDQAVAVSSPRALTEINIAVKKVMDLGKTQALLLDSLSTLLAYSDRVTVTKFIQSLSNDIRGRKSKCVLMAVKDIAGEELIKDISMFADSVADV